MRLNLNKQVLLVLSMVFMGACRNEANTNTVMFEKYLHTSFGTSIPKESQFIVVSSTACGACAEHVFQLAKAGNTPYTFIFPRFYRDRFDGSEKSVLIDTTVKIDRLALHQRKIAKVKVINSQVSGVTVYDPRNITAIAEN